MTKLILAGLLVLSVAANAQQGKGVLKSENLINISYTQQLYLNRYYIENDGVSPNPISAHNTTGYNIGCAYEHITRYGLSFSYGMEYGMQQYNMHVYYDLTNYNPGFDALKGQSVNNDYYFKTMYINNRFLLGYTHHISKGWEAEIKAGIAEKFFSRSMNSMSEGWIVDYYSNDGRTRYISDVYTMTANLGTSREHWSLNPNKNTYQMTYECRFGIRKDYMRSVIKNVCLGIEFTKAKGHDEGSYQVMFYSYDHNGKFISRDVYYNKNLSLGLYLGVGLW